MARAVTQKRKLIATLADSRPEKIALALPLQGPLATAGKAIRDGFLAAYYLDDTADRGKTDIRHALPSMPMRLVTPPHSASMRVIRSWVARTRASLG